MRAIFSGIEKRKNRSVRWRKFGEKANRLSEVGKATDSRDKAIQECSWMTGDWSCPIPIRPVRFEEYSNGDLTRGSKFFFFDGELELGGQKGGKSGLRGERPREGGREGERERERARERKEEERNSSNSPKTGKELD